VAPRTGLGDVERRKILLQLGLELRPLGLPARSQPLCGLFESIFNNCGWKDRLINLNWLGTKQTIEELQLVYS
jgi:hypothetical protein